ncbi:MAG: pyridoxamine kinase [Clostridia bacterium]|nr:pyridoxamine kinase [Clostridia bacterium]
MTPSLPIAACVNDLSGIGRASLTVAIPVLSVMGVQCCPLPTAILSAQTGCDHYSFVDFTPHMHEYFAKWQEEGVTFDALYTGFLGSEEQIAIVRDIVSQKPDAAWVLVDPVMADHGRMYATYTEAMCRGMRDLVRIADIVTPNITEACLLTDSPYMGETLSARAARSLCENVAALGPNTVVLTGIRIDEHRIGSGLYEAAHHRFTLIEKELSAGHYPGTGDLFASVLCGALLRGAHVAQAVDKAAGFVARVTSYTAAAGTDPKYGVLLEHCLKELI